MPRHDIKSPLDPHRHVLRCIRDRAIRRWKSDPRCVVPELARRHGAADDADRDLHLLDLAGWRIGTVVGARTSGGIRASVVPGQRVPLRRRVRAEARGPVGDGYRRLPPYIGNWPAAGVGILAGRERAFRPAQRQEGFRPHRRRRHIGWACRRGGVRESRRPLRRSGDAPRARRASTRDRVDGLEARGLFRKSRELRGRKCGSTRI